MSNIVDAKLGEFVSSATVRVMRSHDYCHFEIVLGLQSEGVIYPLSRVDDLRKDAARLADKAVEQYRRKKESIIDAEHAEYLIDSTREEAEVIEKMSETDRTPEQQATLKGYKDAVHHLQTCYNYED